MRTAPRRRRFSGHEAVGQSCVGARPFSDRDPDPLRRRQGVLARSSTHSAPSAVAWKSKRRSWVSDHSASPGGWRRAGGPSSVTVARSMPGATIREAHAGDDADTGVVEDRLTHRADRGLQEANENAGETLGSVVAKIASSTSGGKTSEVRQINSARPVISNDRPRRRPGVAQTMPHERPSPQRRRTRTRQGSRVLPDQPGRRPTRTEGRSVSIDVRMTESLHRRRTR